METILYFKVSDRLLNDSPGLPALICKKQINLFKKKLFNASKKGINPTNFTIGLDGDDFIKARKTFYFKMQVYKIPRILNPLRRYGRKKYQNHRKSA